MSTYTPELADLMEHERVIEQGLTTFIDVGNALVAIRDGKKYRAAGHATFEDYCANRWQFSRNYATRLMSAAATFEALEETVPIGTVLPTAEGQIRPLARLRDDPDEMRAAWAEAVERADGNVPTEAIVREVVAKRAAPAIIQPIRPEIIPPTPAPPAVHEAKWAAEETKPAPAPRTPMAVPKKTVAEGIPPHPATYPEAIIAIFREAIPAGSKVLDPFAGVGTIHQLRPDIETHGIEIEAKWAAANPLTVVGNSRNAHNIFAGQTFDAIATSPAYGNRLADSYKAADPHARRSYSIDLGQPLEADNGGGLHFATDGRYEELHEAVWESVVSLLRPGGLFLLNCKDFRRNGKIMRPTGWHMRTLTAMGLRVTDLWTLPFKGLAFTDAEPMSELVIALEK